MVEFPRALNETIENELIKPEEAIAIIEELFGRLMKWQCSREKQPGVGSIVEDRCSCHQRKDNVLIDLIGIMSKLDLESAEQLAETVIRENLGLSALVQVFLAEPKKERLDRVISTAQDSIENPWAKAQFFYDLAAAVSRTTPNSVRGLFELAERSLEEPKEVQVGLRIGPNRMTLSIAKGKALARQVSSVDQLSLVTEAFEAIEHLLQLESKLQALDPLLDDVINWPVEDRLELLWHLWQLGTAKKLADVQAIISLSVPIVESIAGDNAFWQLYEYVEQAYDYLPLEYA
jgi:hypothetical protein